MKTEKIVLSLIAVLFGLLVAGALFYLFQASKTVSNTTTKAISFASPTPSPFPSIFLTLDRPKDEEVVSKKILIVSGKTSSNAIVTVITDSSQDVITPSTNGDFSTTVSLDEGQNVLSVISIAPNGESVAAKKTVTYSQEEF
jgi:hypothetical protein